MMLETTDPHLFWFDPKTAYLYAIDDFGNAFRVPSFLWYAPEGDTVG